jgi:peptidoglycan/xylan/chitin deacetylase (PgdA/CDA1 family)
MSGSATISVEIELGWGFHDKADPRDVPELSDDGRAERDALAWFLNACDDAGIPVTFNVVGHLLLESCDGSHHAPHPDGWFDRDPGTDADADPLFYAPEVVEMIREAEVDHEICTHTFSHVLLDEVADDVIDWELDRAQDLHDEPIVSLVPPRHRKPPYHILRDHGIEVVRRAVAETPPASTVGWFLWALTRDHPLDHPRAVDGIVETRTSSFMTLTASYLSSGVSQPHPAYRAIPRRIRTRRHENFLQSGLDEATREDSHIHYWTHLYNMAHNAQREPVGDLLNSMAGDDDFDVLRMSDLRSVHM